MMEQSRPSNQADRLPDAIEPLAELARQGPSSTASWPTRLAQSAEQLRCLSEDGAALIDPILTYAVRVSDITESWVDLLRPPGGPPTAPNDPDR